MQRTCWSGRRMRQRHAAPRDPPTSSPFNTWLEPETFKEKKGLHSYLKIPKTLDDLGHASLKKVAPWLRRKDALLGGKNQSLIRRPLVTGQQKQKNLNLTTPSCTDMILLPSGGASFRKCHWTSFIIEHTQTIHPILAFLSFRQANVSFGTLTTTAAWQLVGTKLDVHLSRPKAWTVASPMDIQFFSWACTNWSSSRSNACEHSGMY